MSTSRLYYLGPRYAMGIGFAEGVVVFLTLRILTLIVSIRYPRMRGPRCGHGKYTLSCPWLLLTIQQADCVFPTRTARFGVALTFKGPLNLSELCSRSHHLWLILTIPKDLASTARILDLSTRHALVPLVPVELPEQCFII
jgi:hypothetical protein